MSFRRVYLGLTAAAALAGGIVTAGTAAAQTAAAPEILELACERSTTTSHECTVTVSGQVAAINWTVDGAARPGAFNQRSITVRCVDSDPVVVSVLVANRTGRDSAVRRAQC